MKTFVVAGTHSGVGKTTVATGLMAALAGLGHRVQGFKVGPDFIDPSYHALASGKPSRNLDLWMCKAKAVLETFHRSAADVNVIEGVMGLFDGALDGGGTTAAVAKLLKAPVVLVVDAQAMAQSAGAIVHGFATFDLDVRVSGVIFNRVSSMGHYEYLRRASRVPSLGWISADPAIALPERHLGLVPAAERKTDVRRLGRSVARHVDLDRLLALSVAQRSPVHKPHKPRRTVRVGYGLDEAFSFYYEDNLDLLREAGAEMIPFSPIRREMPEVDALYLGGGFPEVHRIKAHPRLRAAVRAGMPVYAECGGLMYLVGQGLLPGRIEMTDRLQDFGYAEAVALGDSVAVRRGQKVRGHQFHYSRWIRPRVPAAYRVGSRAEGFARGNIHASYVHVHFGGAPECASRFVASAAAWTSKH